MFIIRSPVAAGRFYNSDKNLLTREIEASFRHKLGPKEIKKQKMVAAIVPHDKYHLCGYVAAWIYSKIEKANYVILGANHARVGMRFAIMREGLWKTPLGEIAINSKIAQKIIDKTEVVEYDVIAHENEHSIEVQLPFLQYRFGSDFKFIPISIINSFGDKDFIETCKFVGKTMASILRAEKEKWIIIATSDFSQGSKEQTEKIDKQLINSIKNLSEDKFFKKVMENDAFVCGYGAILTALAAAKKLRAKRSKLLKYATSFDTLQNPTSVSGYAAIMIY